MAQSIVLKRSALSGKVPDTGSLSLGEVAINTYDGRVFFKKSGSVESVEHIVTSNSITTGSITLTQTGSFGEIVVTQDGNFQRDIFVTRDIVANGDIDVLGSLTASLANGYVWVGNGSNKTTLVPTSSFGGALSGDVNLLISKTGSYATTGSNLFIGSQTISGSLILTSSLTLNDTSNQILVRNTGSGIIEYASINSLLNTKNLVTVGLSGSDGAQFNSIKAAVDSITDASEYNTYTVRVGPGVFYETAIAMKSWITIKGDSTTTTIVSASNASASVFIGADQSMIIDMQIQGTTAPSQSAVVYSSPTTPQTNAIFYVENVRFGTNYTHAKVIGTSGGNCIMQCSNVKYGGYPFTLGFHVTNDGSGIGRMQLRNVTSTNGGVTTTTGLIFAKADQPGCAFIVNGCLLTKAVGAAAGTGFWVENGASLRLTSVNFQRWEKAIYAPNVGSAPSIFGSALNFENNTYDVFVEHPTITGHIDGTDTFLKSIIPADAPLYEINTDPRRLVVAKKGGDFSSISASVAWIDDSSASNRYIIEVGPGEFTENQIDLRGKPYVSIVGSSIQTTHIMPAGSGNFDQFILGPTNEISFLSIMGLNNAGYSAIRCEDLGEGFAQAHKISIYDFDYGVKVFSANSASTFYGEYIDINGAFTYGTYVSSSNGLSAIGSIENYYLFPTGGVSTGNYGIGTGAEIDLYTCLFVGDSVSGSSAIKLENGAVLEASGLDIQNWEYGMYVPNTGTAPTFRIVGSMIHDSITYDFNILKAGTQGRFQGLSNHEKINNLSEDFYWNFLDDADGENDITRKLSVTFADGTHTDASTLIFKGSPMGLIDGGNITISSGLTITVASGFGYLQDTLTPDVIKRIDWTNTNLTLTANSNNYIYFNDDGTLLAAGSEPDVNNNIILGRVVTNNTTIEFIDDSPYLSTHMASNLSLFNRSALGPVYEAGSIVSENVTPLKLDITAGTYFYSENKFTPSSGSQISFIQYYQSASVYNRQTTTTTIPTNVYNSGSSLVAMSSSYYTKHTLYLSGQGVNQKYFLLVGQNQYSTLVETEDATLPTPPSYFSDGVVPVASIYVQSGSANLIQIQDIRPIIGFRAAGVNASSVHGNLLGLDQDDHTQYLLVNGNRSMVGNLNLGNNDITNVDSITATTINGSINATNGVVSGSSQITISSTTGYSTFSSSLDSRLDNLESFTSSLDVNYVNQTELATATGSLINSIATKLNTSSFNSYTSSNDSRVSSLESFTASLDVTYVNQTELANATGSLINSIATKLNTSSFETYTGSIDNKFTTLSSVTASLINATSSYETIGRGIVSGSSQLTSSFVQNSQTSSMTVLAANTVAVASSVTTTDSTLYPTFTNNIVNATVQLKSHPSGTFYYDGVTRKVYAEAFVGAIEATNGIVSGSSQVVGILTSLNSYTASNDTTNTSQNSRLSSLESFTSSLDVTYVNQTELANATGSLINSIATKLNTSSFETYTGSVDNKFSAVSNSTASLNSFTSSTNTRISNLESFSSSLDVTFVNQTELATATGSLINSIATKLDTSSFEVYTGSIDTKFTTLSNVTSSLISKTGSYATTGSNIFYGNQTIAGNVLPNTPNTHSLGSLSNYWNEIYLHSTSSIKFIENGVIQSTISSTVDGGVQIGNVVITTSSIVFVDNDGNITETVAESSSAGSTSNFTTTASFNEYTSSTNSRLNNLESFTASLDVTYVNQTELATATGSLINSIATKLNTSSFQTYTASIDSKFTTIANVTSSLNASTASQQISIDALNVFSASEISKNTTLAIYTASIDTKFTTLSNVTSSLNTFTASANSRLNSLENFTASIDNTYVNQTELANATGSLINSIATKLNTSSFETYTGSIDNKFSTLSTYTSSIDAKFVSLSTTTASLLIETSNLELFSASALNRLTNIEQFSSSENSKNTTLATYTGSIDTKFTTLSTYTSSVDNKLTNLINKTGSYATTGSNTLYGTQTMSGSVFITGDLVVIGSSSIQNISASSVSIGDNQIILNTFTPAIRFGGVSVIDSGSSGTTGSLWWDSVNNHWLYEHPGDSPASYNSAILIAGPTNTGSLGQEVGLTTNKLTVGIGTDHISSSQIHVDNSSVSIPSDLYITGSILAKGSGSTIINISGSRGELFKVIDTDTNILAEVVSGSYKALEIRRDLVYTSGSFQSEGVITGSYFVATNNGNGTNFKVGDDVWIGDVNLANTMQISGQQSATSAHIRFGSGSSSPVLGANNSSTLQLTGSLSISGSLTIQNRPAFRVTGAGGGKTAVTTLSGSYLNVDYQQGGGWDNATGTFTAPIAGLYQVNVVVRTNSNSLGTISQLIVYKNNTGGTTGTVQIMIEFGSNTTMNHAGGSTISKLAVGDTLKMVVAVGEISFDVNDNFSVAYLG